MKAGARLELGWNIDTILSIVPCALALAVIVSLLRISWKQYGLLMLIAAASGVALCLLFVGLGLYSFPFRLFPSLFGFPVLTLILVFPAYAAAAVRFSPKPWGWKIPYYWALVHLAVLTEELCEAWTNIIRYSPHWTLWESYALWWVFMLAFEWLGGAVVRPENRKPINSGAFRYGRPGFIAVHIVLIATIFLAGLYVGVKAFTDILN
jgi:hypothetical protein